MNSDKLGAVTTSLETLFLWLVTLSVKNLFLMSSVNFTWCTFIPFPHVLSLVTREGNSPSTASLKEVVNCEKITPQPSLLQAEQTKWPQPLLLLLRPFTILVTLLWTCSNGLMSLYWGCQNCTQHLKWGCTSVVQSGAITSLDQLAMLCLMHPRTQLALLAVKAHYWFMFSLPSTRTCRSLSAGLLFSLSSSNLYV